MKNAKKYIKLYNEKSQESFNKWGYYYPPRNWEEFRAWDIKAYQKYLEDEHKAREQARPDWPYIKPKRYLSILDTIVDFGYLHAFEKMDYKILNDVIFQVSRHQLLHHSMLASGTDHSNLLLNVLSAFASNDFKIVESFFPKDLPQSKGIYCTEVAVNLLKVMYYNQKEFAVSAIEKAHKFLTKKITSFEEHFVRSFMAIYQRDVDAINFSLQELCKAYQRLGYPVKKMDKCFAVEIHGLYRFIKEIDENFFNEITLPKHDCFFQGFEVWQKENNYPEGKIFYEYPGEMVYMNKIFRVEIPKVTLEEYVKGKRKELFKDVDEFASRLTKNIELLE